MRLAVGSATDVGRARAAKANEDSYLRDDEAAVFAVADGMGGHRAGEVASSMALEAVGSAIGEGATLADAIAVANAEVFARAQANPEMRGMGTTVTVMVVAEGAVHFGHVGDSRAYLLRDGQLTQVTDDHSLVEELVREGRLTPEEAAVHPQRNIVTRALGVDEAVDVDTYEIDLRPADRILVCSDGLTSMIRDSAIEKILRAHADPQKAADKLVDAANTAGGEDNITVVVVDVVGDEADVAAATARAFAAGAQGESSDGEPTGEWDPIEGALAPEVAPAPRSRPRPTLRGVTRIARWAIPVVVIVTVAVAALGWYARNSYHVGLEGDRVVLYQGLAGGLLVWDPTVEARSDLTAEDLSANDRDQVTEGKEFSSRGGAERYLRSLEAKFASTSTTSTSTTVPTSTTTTR